METLTPTDTAKELLARKEPASKTTKAVVTEICLEAAGGYFVLAYDGDIPASSSYDWIGLFDSDSASDGNWVDGAWNWATKGKAYKTSVAVATSGYQARYLIWDGKQYLSIARSKPFLPICN